MKVKFKNVEKEFKASYMTEQRVIRDGTTIGWVSMISLSDESITAQELDNILIPDNISEISCIGEDFETPIVNTITGYEKVTSCVVKYTSSKTTAEIQMTKGV